MEDLGDEISVTGEISVIEMSRRLVVDRIPFSEVPSGVAIAPDGAFAYVTHGEFLSIVEVVSNRVIARVSLGTGRFARAVAISPDGTSAYVTTSLLSDWSSSHSELSSAVSIIDVQAKMVVATIPVEHARSIAIAPDGAFLYVVNEGDGSRLEGAVSVIDTKTNAVTATINVGAGPVAVAISSNGTSAYVANSDSNEVSVIETASNTVIATIPVGRLPEGLAITPDSRFVYVTNWYPSSSDSPIGPGNVMVIDTSTNTVVATVPVGWWPSFVAVF